jgi:hypothetical protein
MLCKPLFLLCILAGSRHAASQDTRVSDSIRQAATEVDAAKCAYAVANGLVGILGKLSGCKLGPPGEVLIYANC